MTKEAIKRSKRLLKAMQPTSDIAGPELILPNTSNVREYARKDMKTNFTDGYIPFFVSSKLTEDSKFFWDNTNKRLGIGTTSPASELEVSNGTNGVKIDCASTSVIAALNGSLNLNATGNMGIIASTYVYLRSASNNHMYLDCGGFWNFRDYDNAYAVKVTIDSANGNITTTGNLNFSSQSSPRIIMGTSELLFRDDMDGGTRMSIADNGDVYILGKLSIQGSNPAGAKLHVGGTDGIIIPIGTTGQRVATQGMIRYNTTTNKFEGYNGTAWTNLN